MGSRSNVGGAVGVGWLVARPTRRKLLDISGSWFQIPCLTWICLEPRTGTKSLELETSNTGHVVSGVWTRHLQNPLNVCCFG